MNRKSLTCFTANRQSIAGPLFLVLFFSMLPERTRAVNVDQILKAWSQRKDVIMSAQIKCNLTRIEMVDNAIGNSSPPTVDPYEKPAAKLKRAVTLDSQIVLSMQGSKLACVRTGELWNPQNGKKMILTQTDCFDGRRSQFLNVGGVLPLAEVESGKLPTDHLVNHVETFPPLLSISPWSALEYRNYLVTQIQIISAETTSDGIPCVELSIPTSVGELSAGVLYVDPARSYLPIKFVLKRKNRVAKEINLEYKSDVKCDWVLSQWRTSHFDGAGDPTLRIDGVVESYVVNESLNENTFSVSFPVGTNIHEEGKGDYIQQSDGTRKPIASSEFGLISPGALAPSSKGSRLPLVLTAVTVLVLVISVYWKHLKHRRL